MHYDQVHGWLLTKEDFLSAGYSYENFHKNKVRGAIITTARACKSKHSEIIYSKCSPKVQSFLKQRFAQLDEDRAKLMLDAKMAGMDLTELAVHNTSNLLELNAPFIQREIETYIQKEYGKYTSHYLELGLKLSNRSILGYAKICALGSWIYTVVEKIQASARDERSRGRLMRSLRVNLLTALDTMHAFEIAIPRNEIRFSQWMDELITGMQTGKHITEIVEVKRAGNTNPERFTTEQKMICDNLWISGSGLGARQVWDKMVEIGRTKGWWSDKTGAYKPVSYATIASYIEQRENILMGARTDYVNAYNNYYTVISREWPQNKNMAWGIDGTGHNENVYHNGKSRQHLSVIKIFDYATFRNLHNEPTIGFTETGDIVIKAIKEAIKFAGYKPHVLQMDQGPAYTAVKVWCEACGIKVMPTGKGRARSKPVELMLGMFDNMITRYLSGFTGMNRTALGRSSKPSESYEHKGKTYAVSADIASQWLRTIGKQEWNSHIIENMQKQRVDKTPDELWNEKQSETPRMDLMEMARLCGTKHTKKLENEGLEIQHNRMSYMYYPPVSTPEEQQKAAEIFTTTPRHKDEGSQLDIFIVEYGKPAPVFKKNLFLGYWTLKQRVSMFAAFESNTTDYLNIKRVPEIQHEMSKQAEKDARTGVERLGYDELIKGIAKESMTGRKRVIGRYDKQELNMEEFVAKAKDMQQEEMIEIESLNYKEYIDTDTGEVHRIKTNKS